MLNDLRVKFSHCVALCIVTTGFIALSMVEIPVQRNAGHRGATMDHQSVTPTEMDTTLFYLKTMTPSEKETSRKKTMVLEKATVSPREMSATPNGQSKTLKWASLITEVETYSQDG